MAETFKPWASSEVGLQSACGQLPTSDKKRVLIIAQAFPPSYINIGKRPYLLAKELLKRGWHVDVLTSALEDGVNEVETLKHSACVIRRLQNPLARLINNLKIAMPISRTSRLALRVLLAVMWPDEYVLWTLRMLRVLRMQNDYDIVIATLQPKSILLLGVFRLPVGPKLILDYQDSIYPQFRSFPRKSPFHRLLRFALEWVERRALHKASLALFTSSMNMNAYLRLGLVSKERAVFAPHFFDNELYNDVIEPSHDWFSIMCAGKFGLWVRTPESFLRALAQFLSENPEARSVTRFVFYGNWIHNHDHWIQELGLSDVVDIYPAIEYRQYLHELKRSQVLLLTTSSEHNLSVPGKLSDYLGAYRPILAFVPDESETADLLRRAGFSKFLCTEDDWQKGSRVLSGLWKSFQAGEIRIDQKQVLEWSTVIQANRIVGILEDQLASRD